MKKNAASRNNDDGRADDAKKKAKVEPPPGSAALSLATPIINQSLLTDESRRALREAFKTSQVRLLTMTRGDSGRHRVRMHAADPPMHRSTDDAPCLLTTTALPALRTPRHVPRPGPGQSGWWLAERPGLANAILLSPLASQVRDEIINNIQATYKETDLFKVSGGWRRPSFVLWSLGDLILLSLPPTHSPTHPFHRCSRLETWATWPASTPRPRPR